MTELSSKDEAAGADSPGSYRTAVPAPPRPPAPLYDDDPRDDRLDDAGPATSAMSAVPSADAAAGDMLGGGFASSYTTYTPLPGDVLGSPPMTGPTRPIRGYDTQAVDKKSERKRRVTVRGPRRAKLVLRRVDPWSVLKFSILFSVCMVVIWVVAVSSLFSLLRTMHVFDNINSVLASATSDPTSKGIHIDPTSHQVTEWAAILGAVNALLFTALATLGTFAYNLVSMLVGGVEVTLAERD
jgi:Transmembrane domain of unknown function (DUF3566)